jgi:hypothetical protein
VVAHEGVDERDRRVGEVVAEAEFVLGHADVFEERVESRGGAAQEGIGGHGSGRAGGIAEREDAESVRPVGFRHELGGDVVAVVGIEVQVGVFRGGGGIQAEAFEEDEVDQAAGGEAVVREAGIEEEEAAVLEDDLVRVGGAEARGEGPEAGGGPLEPARVGA